MYVYSVSMFVKLIIGCGIIVDTLTPARTVITFCVSWERFCSQMLTEQLPPHHYPGQRYH